MEESMQVICDRLCTIETILQVIMAFVVVFVVGGVMLFTFKIASGGD